MSIDFGGLLTTDNYSTAFVPKANASTVALAQLLDPTYAVYIGTPPTGAKRLNAGVMESFNGTAWVGQSVNGTTYAGGVATLTGALTVSGAVTAASFSGPLTGHASLDLPLTGGIISTSAPNVLTIDSTAVGGGYAVLTQSGSVYGYVGNALALTVGGAIADMGIRFNNALSISGSSGAERVRIDTGGNVGLSTAGARLVVGNTTNVGAGQLYVFKTGAVDVPVEASTNTVSTAFGTNASAVTNLWGAPAGSSYIGNQATYPLVFTTAAVRRMQITAAGVIQDAAGNELGYKGLPTNTQGAAYTVVQGDNGKKIQQQAVFAITVNTGLSDDFVCSVANGAGSAISLVAGAGVTFHLAGTSTTGNRTLAVWGVANFVKIAGVEIYIVSGNVI